MDPAEFAQMTPEEKAAAVQKIMNGPAMPAPPGEVPLANPGGEHALGIGIVITCAVLSTLSILIRLASRAVVRKLRIEDGLFICGLGLFAGNAFVLYRGILWPGLQVHQWDIQYKYLPDILYDAHLGSLFYGLVIMLLKAGILLDWINIFVPKGTYNAMFWIAHVLIWSNVIFYVVGTFFEIFKCDPREKIWNPLIPGWCFDIRAHNIASGVVNIVSDIAILALPQHVIWKLNMSKARKIGISFLFGVGVLALAFCICRFIYTLRMLNTPDTVYTVGPAGLWCIAEETCGFLIVGIPCIPKVFKALPMSESMRSFMRTLTHSRSKSSGGATAVAPGSPPLDGGEKKKKKRQPSSWGRRGRAGPWDVTEDGEMDERDLVNPNHSQSPPGTGEGRVWVDSESGRTRVSDGDGTAHHESQHAPPDLPEWPLPGR